MALPTHCFLTSPLTTHASVSLPIPAPGTARLVPLLCLFLVLFALLGTAGNPKYHSVGVKRGLVCFFFFFFFLYQLPPSQINMYYK